MWINDKEPEQIIEYKKCDYCSCQVPEFTLTNYKESGMDICPDCQPKYEREELAINKTTTI